MIATSFEKSGKRKIFAYEPNVVVKDGVESSDNEIDDFICQFNFMVASK